MSSFALFVITVLYFETNVDAFNVNPDHKCFNELAAHYGFNDHIVYSCGSDDNETENETPETDLHKNETLLSRFQIDSYNSIQADSLINLLIKISNDYLVECPAIIYYEEEIDSYTEYVIRNVFKVNKRLLIL